MLNFCQRGLLTLALSAALAPFLRAADPSPAASTAPDSPQFEPAAIEFFEKQVRPLLVERCFKCHGPDKQQGTLRLDSRAAILKGGDTGPALVAGKPAESELVAAINYAEGGYQMPPTGKLPDTEIGILTKWVELGAPWSAEAAPSPEKKEAFDLEARKASYWAWQPVANPAVPNSAHAELADDPIDRFVIAKLDEHGLSLAAEADRRTLARRLSFDLLGLPPEPDDVAEFLAADQPDAYERLTDRWLASPRFGERWARHWMDLVRYAESLGHEFDYPIPLAWKYRDYLIRALNADVPYDRFLVEHVAGDLLPQPRVDSATGVNESIIATGFWFLGEATHAPVDVRGDEAGRIDNQIDVFSKTFLGLTVACARCHDHKFDAISTKDYYALAGYLQSSRRQEAFQDPRGRVAHSTSQLADLHARGSSRLRVALPPPGDELTDATRKILLAARTAILEADALAESSGAAAGGPNSSDADTIVARLAKDQNIDAGLLARWVALIRTEDVRRPGHPIALWAKLCEPGASPEETIRAERQRVAERNAQAVQSNAQKPLIADFNGPTFGDWFVTGTAFGEGPIPAGTWDARSDNVQLAPPGVADSGRFADRARGVLRSPTFELKSPFIHYRLAGRDAQIRVIIDGYVMDTFNALLFGGISFDVKTDGKWQWQTQNVAKYLGHRAHLELIDAGDGFLAVDEIRFSDTADPPDDGDSIADQILHREASDSLESVADTYAAVIGDAVQNVDVADHAAQRIRLLNTCLAHDLLPGAVFTSSTREALSEQRKQIAERAAELPIPDVVLAMADGSGEDESVHIRGNHQKLGDVVPRRLLEAIAGVEQPAAGPHSGRLELAERVVDASDPFPPRVAVNRLWQHLLGRGIVPSVDNFGVLGQAPSHPELLDHLATRFVASGWSMKSAIRDIVTSRTYRQSSQTDPRAAESDPENIWLHHARLRRLEGEAIRDAILAISGRLETRMQGPSIRTHLTEFMEGRGRQWIEPGGPLDGDGRRSVYLGVNRNFLSPLLLAFDTPIPFSTVGARSVSNVPAQALILLNDQFVLEQARTWARRTLSLPNAAPADRIADMYQRAFARTPSEKETAAALKFFAAQGQLYGIDGDAIDSNEQIWTDFAHVLLNSKELIYVP